MAVGIDSVFTTEGTTNVNFFNGRILTAEDLRSAAEAGADHRRKLGRAIGPGVASGLRATTAGGLTIHLTEGIAVNQRGDVIRLPVAVDVNLGRAPRTPDSPPTTLFAECPGARSDDLDTTVGGAFYLLTIRPASESVGRAPGADPSGLGTVCGPGWTRDGVRFRRVGLDLGTLFDHPEVSLPEGVFSLADPISRSRLRSELAHLFLGTPWLIAQGREPDTPEQLEQAWADANLDRCEVPIALVGIRGSQIVLVDEWAVRRPPTHREPESPHGWELLLDERRRSVGVRALLQFQAQLAQRIDESDSVEAISDFGYLPAAGILPPATELFGPPRSIDDQTSLPFLEGLPHRIGDLFIGAHEVEPILRSAAPATPVSLSAPRGPINVFQVVDSETSTQLYAVFVYQEHWSGMLATIVDLAATIDNLAKRLETLEAEDTAEASVRVIRPRDVATIREGGRSTLAFLVRVGSAGTYRIDDPTISFQDRRTSILVTASVVGNRTFSTDAAASREVTVDVAWRKTRPTFPTRHEPRTAEDETFGGLVLGETFGLVDGGLLAERSVEASELFGEREGRLPPSGVLARVRLTVHKTDDPTTTGFDDAPVLFAS